MHNGKQSVISSEISCSSSNSISCSSATTKSGSIIEDEESRQLVEEGIKLENQGKFENKLSNCLNMQGTEEMPEDGIV
jgi:hypothetical protein